MPPTRAAASAAITELQQAVHATRQERRAEAAAISRSLAAGPASSVQAHELEGYGSTARYAGGPDRSAEDDRARGDEHCRGIAAFPSPYYHGLENGSGRPMSRADARRAYAGMLWRLIQRHGTPVVARLAALDGTLTNCARRIHPCQRETLADAATWAASQLRRGQATPARAAAIAPVVNVARAERGSYTYVGRGCESGLGNPYSHVASTARGVVRVETRAQAIECYYHHLWGRVANEGQSFIECLAIVRDQTLGCHCHPLPCHAHVLAGMVAWSATLLDRMHRD